MDTICVKVDIYMYNYFDSIRTFNAFQRNDL